MSGIAGIYHLDGAPAAAEHLQRMAAAAIHRAPDGIGYWIEGSVGLAHLAQHITAEDLKVAQPVHQREGQLTITAYARVDNREALIGELLRSGFLEDKQPADAELILACYRRWGTECAAHLIADFAFAIWDGARKLLFAARDLLGTRPFYYRLERGRFCFASEVKQILTVPGVTRALNEAKLVRWLADAEGGNADTFYQGIQHLEAGHALVVGPEGARVWRYGDFSAGSIRYRHESEYADHFRELFLTAVRSRLRSIKPIGISLSGGMDSSSVAAAAGWWLTQGGLAPPPEVRAYAYAFEKLSAADERHISAPLAQHFGFPFAEIPAEENWPLKDYPRHGPDMDDPNLGPYQVMKNAALLQARADGVGAMMTGFWGDHVVGDCWPYVDQLLAANWGQMWADMRAHGAAWGWRTRHVVGQYLLRPLPGYLWPPRRAARARAAAGKLLRAVQGRKDQQDRGEKWPAWLQKEALRRNELHDASMEQPPQSRMSGYAAGVRYMNLNTAHQQEATIWQERSYAAGGLTLTHVWNDRRLIEFVLSIPPRIISHRGAYKPFARAVMQGIMPNATLQAVRKIYPVPLFWWAVKGPAYRTIRAQLEDSRLAQMGIVDAEALQNQFEKSIREEDTRANDDIWNPLAAEMWLRAYWT